MSASFAPRRRATLAASIAVLPPPYTATRRPITGCSPEATLRRNDTASTIRPASFAGMSTRLDRWAPTATKAASNPSSVFLQQLHLRRVLLGRAHQWRRAPRPLGSPPCTRAPPPVDSWG